MKDALFQEAKREIEALGVQILEAKLLPEMAGSWYIIVNSQPMLRLMWDRSSGWLVLEERIVGIPAGPLIWRDIWIAENFDGAAIKRGVEIIGKMTEAKSGAANLDKKGDRMDVKKMLDNLKVAAIASDPLFKVTYINRRGEELFKALLNAENLVGTNMRSCHKPETVEKLEKLYQEYQKKERNLDYYVMDTPGGKATIVNVPFYEDDRFAGVVEFIFESSLA